MTGSKYCVSGINAATGPGSVEDGSERIGRSRDGSLAGGTAVSVDSSPGGFSAAYRKAAAWLAVHSSPRSSPGSSTPFVLPSAVRLRRRTRSCAGERTEWLVGWRQERRLCGAAGRVTHYSGDGGVRRQACAGLRWSCKSIASVLITAGWGISCGKNRQRSGERRLSFEFSALGEGAGERANFKQTAESRLSSL